MMMHRRTRVHKKKSGRWNNFIYFGIVYGLHKTVFLKRALFKPVPQYMRIINNAFTQDCEVKNCILNHTNDIDFAYFRVFCFLFTHFVLMLGFCEVINEFLAAPCGAKSRMVYIENQ